MLTPGMFSALFIPFWGAFTTEGLEENVLTMLSGFVVVMSVLITLMVLISLIGLAFKQSEEKKAKAVLEGSAPAGSSDMDHAHSLAAPTLALIAAAVHTTVQGPYRIVGIQPRHTSSEGENVQVSSWSVEGRRAIFSSHRVR